MVLSDFLSRQTNNDSNSLEIILISFNMQHVLQEHYYNLEIYIVQTRSQTKTSGIKLPEIHDIGKSLHPNIKPEKQQAQSIKDIIAKPHIGQGRARLKRSKRLDPINQAVTSQSELSKRIPEEGIMTDESGAHINNKHKQCVQRDVT